MTRGRLKHQSAMDMALPTVTSKTTQSLPEGGVKSKRPVEVSSNGRRRRRPASGQSKTKAGVDAEDGRNESNSPRLNR